MNPTQPDNPATIWELLKLPSHWPMQTDLLQWCHEMGPAMATGLIIAGIIYLLFGWYMFRALIALNAGLAGAYVGARLGHAAGSAAVGAVVGMIFVGAVTWPAMKYAVALTGGLFGALLGASAWRAANLEGSVAWAGALIGLITFGMLSFIVFKASIMMYTSLQGSVMLIFGILGMMFKYDELWPKVADNLKVQPFLLPLAIFIPMVLGLIYQQTQFGAGGDGGKKKPAH